VKRLATDALLLRSVDFGESDRIIHLLTPETGRLTVMAKGALRSAKRFPGTLDLFNHLKIQVSRRQRGAMAYLDQAALLCAFLPLRESTARFALASYLFELLDRLAPEGGARADVAPLFAFALTALRALSDAQPDRRLRVLLELRTLDALVLRPELARCVRCGRPIPESAGSVGFHVADGGVVCRSCVPQPEGLLRVHLGTLRALERALHVEIESLGRLELGRRAEREAELIVGRFQRFHVGIELRSELFLAGILDSA